MVAVINSLSKDLLAVFFSDFMTLAKRYISGKEGQVSTMSLILPEVAAHTHTHLHNSQEKRKEGKPKGRAIVSVSLEGSSGPLPAADRKSHIVTHSPQTKRYLGFPEGNLRAQDTGSPRGAQASASISAGTIEPEYHSAQVRDTGPPCMVHKVIR